MGKTVSTQDLQDLIKKNLIEQAGAAERGIKYVLKIGSKPSLAGNRPGI